jgi:predicted nucleic acid-binding protein
LFNVPDANVLIAVTLDSYVHHRRAERWFVSRQPERFAT